MNIPFEILTLKDKVESLEKRLDELEEFIMSRIPGAQEVSLTGSKRGPGRPRKEVTS